MPGRSPIGGDAELRSPSRRAVLRVAGGATVLPLSGCLGLGGGGGIEAESLPDRGDAAALADVESFPNEGVDHVPAGTEVEYGIRPPTSGNHYAGTVRAGFYEEPRSRGELVHTLEHGAVVVYYDPDELTEEARGSLRAWANNHAGTWRSIVVAPYDYDGPEAPYTLTAWQHMLRMEEYDAEVVRAFCAEFLGRGPENPVR
ncbi:DUF3105 domain-containing protein [Halorarum salinum]|uniref:DUF3105 domain-containing protein n=1 Tax=Halorarum salinum TaxID=2743089 RepID=A0A7D5QJ69_9EURY|nr:DUF3105 domain-containing protein [Halobaculum salinum]QLG61205.1 DUF3105 domain-containing protein [Halobaculum salinum]